MGTFGSQTHSIFWNNLTQSNGAVLIEVNPKGEIVRTYTFPETLGIYRAIELKTSPDKYDMSIPLIIVGIAVIVTLILVVGITLNKLHLKKISTIEKN
jgi:hypothetical protein